MKVVGLLMPSTKAEDKEVVKATSEAPVKADGSKKTKKTEKKAEE